MGRPLFPVLTITMAALLLHAGSARAWVRPAAPSTAPRPTETAQRLDFVLIEVNGRAVVARDGDEIPVVRGDKISVKDAGLRDRQVLVKELNVVGFQAPKGGNDDRGFVVDTAKDLKPKFSEGGKGEVYAVLAGSKAALNGAVFLRLIEPALRYAEISVNGKTRMLRDGEPVSVHAADKVKVEKVVTNLDSVEGVMFQMTEVDPAQGAYEIRFTRGGLAFATIPLRVKE